jgi:hypothetical protein
VKFLLKRWVEGTLVNPLGQVERFAVVLRFMNKRFFAARYGIILAAASLAIAPLETFALNASVTPSSDAPEMATQASSIESPIQLAQSQSLEETLQSLPEAIAKAVLENVQEQSGKQLSELAIVKVQQETWSDGCLGLGEEICTQAQVPGWLVVVASEEQLWAYRTDATGSTVKLDEELSETITAQVTTELTRRQETTTRRTQTTQSATGSSSRQSSQAVMGSSSQSNQAVMGSSSQSSQAVMGSSSQSAQAVMGSSSQSAQVSGSSTQQQTAAATSRMMQQSSASINFTDVSSSYWASNFIAELAAREIIEGFPDGSFRPNEPVTRAQFAALIRKAFEKNKERNAINFRDVSSSYWGYKAIQEAYQMGFLSGTSNTQFNPNRSLTRLEIMVALTQGLDYSFNGSSETLLGFYGDATSIPANYRNLIAAATQRGIVVNYPNVKSLSLNTVATRAEVAAFIYQALVSTGEVTAISSPYVVMTDASTGQVTTGTVMETQTQTQTQTGTQTETQTGTQREVQRGDRPERPRRQNCNQGIGNGAEGCDPGNSRPRGGSNDEGGRTPGGRR